MASDAKGVYIATDDDRIKQRATAFGATVIMTSVDHLSGTDRLAEAVTLLGLSDDEIVVNLQGDEVGMPAVLINQVAKNLHDHTDYPVATLCKPLDDEAGVLDDPHIVKVAFDQKHSALCFSRTRILPQHGRQDKHFRHIGLYAYRAGYLKQFTIIPPSILELSESLEQLRILENDDEIHVDIACAIAGVGVDTEDDLRRVALLDL